MSIGNYYKDLRAKHVEELRERELLIYSKIPELKDIDKELISLSLSDNNQEIKELSDKKEQLLNENGYSLDDLELEYSCNKCNDTGFIQRETYDPIENTARISQHPCSCRKQLLIRTNTRNSNLRKLNKENFETFNLDVFKNDKQREMMSNYKLILQQYTSSFTRNSKNLLLTGNTGTGKTFLLSCIAKDLIDNGNSVYYTGASEMLHYLERYSKAFLDQQEKFRDRVGLILNSDFLIIDDLGTENLTDDKREQFNILINSRMDYSLPWGISTNLSLNDIRVRYGDRIYSRVMSTSMIFEFRGEDIRIETVN